MGSESSSPSLRRGIGAICIAAAAVTALWQGNTWQFIEQNWIRVLVCGFVSAFIFFFLMFQERWQTQDEQRRQEKEKSELLLKISELERTEASLHARLEGVEYEYSRRIVHVHKEWIKTRDVLIEDLSKAATNIGATMGRPEFSRHMNNIINKNQDVRPELTEVTQAFAVTKDPV